MEVRRSVRLAPKTVATLASKFDNLLSSGEASKKQSKDNVKLGKKDIAKIIGTLEKLDEDAKKESLVLQKNKTTIKKEDIDSMMKSKKSALEQVELPSNSTPEMEVENEVEIEATNTTDKYLQTLQKIAKDNAVTGEFKTSLPHPPHTVVSSIFPSLKIIHSSHFGRFVEEIKLWNELEFRAFHLIF